MERAKIIELALKLGRRIAQTPTITEEEILSDARGRADGDEVAAGLIADLAKEAAPQLFNAERIMAEEFGPTLMALQVMLDRLISDRSALP